uniref:HMG box domain-containing protein n=1 Tax=Panagrellus redivivus TaxID=6233 RepID=A0A7E4VAQ7_PANRE
MTKARTLENEHSKSKKQKRVRKVRDPEAPKRPRSAYIIWLGMNRARLSQPGMPVTEVSKVAGVEWRALEDKTVYEQLAAVDRLRYQKDLAVYNANKAG